MSIQSNILLLGASGFLGSALLKAYNYTNISYTYKNNRILGGFYFDSQIDNISNLIQVLPKKPTAAIILLGKTEIDFCYANPIISSSINVYSIIKIIDKLLFYNIKPIFVSSDGVFEGNKSYWSESDNTNPIIEYGRQKILVENHLNQIGFPCVIVRLPKLLSCNGSEICLINNWIKSLGNQNQILCAVDQFFTPSAVEDVADAIVFLSRNNMSGIFHLGGNDRISRRDLLDLVINEYNNFAQVRAKIVDCSLSDIPVLDLRPKDTSLNSDKFKKIYPHKFIGITEIVKFSVASYFNKLNIS